MARLTLFNNIHYYTEKGKKNFVSHGTNGTQPDLPTDPSGCNFLIDQLMKRQNNFANEITLLQYDGWKLGALVDRSPKCHPKIAREDIEYLWGLTKFWYRKSPITDKEDKRIFSETCHRGNQWQNSVEYSPGVLMQQESPKLHENV